MFHTPAHKQLDAAKQGAQIVNPLRRSVVNKTPSLLRKGDVVLAHGGRFLVTADPHESCSHRPHGYWPHGGVGPSDCAVAPSVCLAGEQPGYFSPGSPWNFQGNHLALVTVEVR